MKRHDLIAQLEHHNPDTGKTEPIPRHREINERLAKKIIKSLTGDR